MENWITLTEFASKVNRSISTVSKWFSTHSEIRAEFCRKVGRELWINPDVVPRYITDISLTQPTLATLATVQEAKSGLAETALSTFKEAEVVANDPMAQPIKDDAR